MIEFVTVPESPPAGSFVITTGVVTVPFGATFTLIDVGT